MSNKLFNDLAKLAPSIADSASDSYDGERSKRVDLAVRRDPHRYIIPSTLNHLRAAPRHLTEVNLEQLAFDACQSFEIMGQR